MFSIFKDFINVSYVTLIFNEKIGENKDARILVSTNSNQAFGFKLISNRNCILKSATSK
jgi:hypothetical protein